MDVVSQKDQLIQQLINETNQMKSQQQQQQTIVTKPEEVKLGIKLEEPRINPEKYIIQESVSQGTRVTWPCRTRRIYRNSNV